MEMDEVGHILDKLGPVIEFSFNAKGVTNQTVSATNHGLNSVEEYVLSYLRLALARSQSANGAYRSSRTLERSYAVTSTK